jgi:uncharacterized RDD family membrane protein YckC
MTAAGHPAEDPWQPPDPSAEAAQSAHVRAAARAQAIAAARARRNAQARDAPPWTEAEREGAYAGLATRTIAYCADALAINVVAIAVSASVALALSLVHALPQDFTTVVDALLAVIYVVWVVGYFAAFWSTTGQTPGARLMRIRVIDARDAPRIGPVRAVVRVGGLVLATLPLFTGFLMMLWDGRRRCLQDHLARTVVVHAPPQARIVRHSVARERR